MVLLLDKENRTRGEPQLLERPGELVAAKCLWRVAGGVDGGATDVDAERFRSKPLLNLREGRWIQGRGASVRVCSIGSLVLSLFRSLILTRRWERLRQRLPTRSQSDLQPRLRKVRPSLRYHWRRSLSPPRPTTDVESTRRLVWDAPLAKSLLPSGFLGTGLLVRFDLGLDGCAGFGIGFLFWKANVGHQLEQSKKKEKRKGGEGGGEGKRRETHHACAREPPCWPV